MANLAGNTALLDAPQTTDSDLDFTLDIRIVEATVPVAELLRSTSDNCGSTCSGSACTSYTNDPSDPIF
jgi:FxLD family lantipeptide